LLHGRKIFAGCASQRAGPRDHRGESLTSILLLADGKQFRLSQPLGRPRIIAPFRRIASHSGLGDGGGTGQPTVRWRVIMQHTNPTRSMAVAANHSGERWLAVSLLAGSVALLAWCVVAL
jgi:hypothetical protein